MHETLELPYNIGWYNRFMCIYVYNDKFVLFIFFRKFFRMAPDMQLLGKRKKKIPKNPNPLFIKWLTQWKNEAAEKELSVQYTYNKVNNSYS